MFVSKTCFSHYDKLKYLWWKTNNHKHKHCKVQLSQKCAVTLDTVTQTCSLISFTEQWQISLWHNLHLWRHNLIYRHGNKRWAVWRHCPPFTAAAERCLLISPCTQAYQASLRGDTVTPSPTPPPCLTLLVSSPHRASPSRAKPGVLSAPDSYQLTLKHKRGERRNRQIDKRRMETQTEWVVMDTSFHHL